MAGTRPEPLDSEASITAIAALGDEQRRRLFSYVQRAHRPVSREEAAASVGISRKLAAHHLDKLVAAGLLEARFGPLGGIRKVGRAPKLYLLAEPGIQISIPERRHEELARILLDAVLTEADGEDAGRPHCGSPRRAAASSARRSATGCGPGGWAPSGP